MEFVRGLHNIKSHHKGCILTIGNFDGFHRGHQALLKKLQKKRNILKLPVVVMIFEPQPKEYLSNIIAIRLTRLRDKVNYLCTAGVDVILCITFNKKFAAIEAYNFIKNILISKLDVRFVYIGDDFRFGAFRKGDFILLKKIGKNEGFKVIRIATYFDENNRRISSTAIRVALVENRILDAELLLGHSYCISGRVVHGDELGRRIGFPTANVSLQGKRLPIHGVYAVEVYGISNHPLQGIANVGIRPTVTGKNQQKLEVHLLNVSTNLYTYHIKVVFLAKIRDEQYFSSVKILQRQIKSDIIKVRSYFNKINNINKIYKNGIIYK
ncbi:bifunctional riboflavin kinase/FAD synthetase [Candidatus Blochmanniella camponoti]|uniref:Riboflavin biosynthesis protein n=1 Tax=Candidatus Blochmanniella camponoti TaxID=108080 RepID=A0ABY4SU75_9ENTR|nr:bifunctional riboflavin kinase/FAD synthetase [Candidatus Blochmannia herculeanus]URJ24555.1 bifunctional riboflavin kinase/FAD synthetase [Candidatus Blochmannia herculeanus]URJ26837.1 bifunctional riboflavin kinase/FAD synthetase [Candidatus Blochmannia herculeanus]